MTKIRQNLQNVDDQGATGKILFQSFQLICALHLINVNVSILKRFKDYGEMAIKYKAPTVLQDPPTRISNK